MSRLNSFHLPAEHWPHLLEPGAPVSLDGPEARHLLGVLRGKPGDVVRLFDGQGREGRFLLRSLRGKAAAELELIEASQAEKPAAGVVLALGWTKSSRRDWLLEKAVELGAAGLWFWRAERSQGDIPPEPKDSWSDKAVQAAKQCGALWLPDFRCVPGGAAGLARCCPEFDLCTVLWEGADGGELLDASLFRSGRHLVILGPEGGLESAEVAQFTEAGCRAASLGPRPLRWETAGLLCLGLAHHALSQQALVQTNISTPDR